MPFIRGSRVARVAESAGSGTGVSEMAVSADAVAGYEEAAARTMARRASGGSSEGSSEGGGGWNRVGCDLSGGTLVEFACIINRQMRRMRRTEFKKLGIDAHSLEKYPESMLQLLHASYCGHLRLLNSVTV